jgi:CRP/FNR family transcriptional regulator
VELLSVTRTDFFTFLRDNPDLALEIITELGQRLREAQNTIRALAMERVEWRIARTLLMLSRKAGVVEADGVSIDLPLTRQDIADMAATTVETTIRVLSNFKKLGLVETEKGKIIIRDKSKLDEMVSEGCAHL